MRPQLLFCRLGMLHGTWSTRVFEDKRAFSRVLEEKYPLLTFRALRIRHPLDQKCPLLIIEPDVAVHGLGKSHSYARTTGDLRKGIDHLLRKRLEENGAGTCATGDDGIHRLCPCPTILLLALRPVVDEQVQRAELIPCILFVLPQSRLRLVSCKHSSLSLLFVLAPAHSFPLRLSVLELLFYFILALDNPACDVAIDRIDQLAFLEHLPGDGFARKESAEVFDGHLLFESVAGFVGKKANLLAQYVVEPPNLVRICDFKMGWQIRHSALTLVAEPGRWRYLLPDFTDNGFINLDPVFQRIECVLQLLDELVGQVWPSRRKA